MTQKNNNSAYTYIDVNGLDCPLPIIHCKVALNKLGKNEVLIFKASDADIFRQINCLIKRTKHTLLDSWIDNGSYFFKLEKILTEKEYVFSSKISPLDLIRTTETPLPTF
jgi:tRNA 2-thiouridine synthesizing protein A